jgi:hypothetical protein
MDIDIMKSKDKLFKELIYCDETKTKYLKALYKYKTIIIFANQRYLIEWILMQLNCENKNFKSLYDLCNTKNFHFYIFAFQNKDYVKSFMFSHWKRK